jgi:hypothetical protein
LGKPVVRVLHAPIASKGQWCAPQNGTRISAVLSLNSRKKNTKMAKNYCNLNACLLVDGIQYNQLAPVDLLLAA